jgi:HK97 family phage portal protein
MDITTEFNTNMPIYPDSKNTTYLASFVGNGNVFSVINKITEPASRLKIYQFDKNGDEKPEGKALQLLNKPNPFQSQSEFLEAALTFYNIFGNTYIAGEKADYGLRAGKITRLDILPPQWVEIILGDYTNPIMGYELTKGTLRKYDFPEVMHWKDFNPDFQESGSHLYGMSRLRPLLQAVTANQSAYDSMVSSFQNMGAYGLLTILGVKDNDGKFSDKPTTKEQLNKMLQEWRSKWSGDSKRGSVAITNKSAEWTPFGLSVQDLSILTSIPVSRGVIADAYNVPDILFAGSEGRTYDNFSEAKKALWQDAIMPEVDNFLEKLSEWLMPQMGEEGDYFAADYDEVAVLQDDMTKKIDWMVKAGLTMNEIRDAIGYEELNLPNMDVPLISMGYVRVDEIGVMPAQDQTEDELKKLGLKDYRENNTK